MSVKLLTGYAAIHSLAEDEYNYLLSPSECATPPSEDDNETPEQKSFHLFDAQLDIMLDEGRITKEQWKKAFAIAANDKKPLLEAYLEIMNLCDKATL